MDEQYLAAAQQFGLGNVADIVFNIPIELYQEPCSIVVIKYYGLVVDRFLGIEQLVSVKPNLIEQVIKYCIDNGWNPAKKGDYEVEIVENTGKKHRPALLFLPGFSSDIQNYENKVKLIKIL